MKSKNTETNWNEPSDEQKFRKSKRYIKRLAQEQEAQKEIDDYITDERNPHRLDGLGLKRGQRRSC